MEMLTSLRENAWYKTGKYPMTKANMPKPMLASITVTARAAAVAGAMSPSPRVKKVVPL